MKMPDIRSIPSTNLADPRDLRTPRRVSGGFCIWRFQTIQLNQGFSPPQDKKKFTLRMRFRCTAYYISIQKTKNQPELHFAGQLCLGYASLVSGFSEDLNSEQRRRFQSFVWRTGLIFWPMHFLVWNEIYISQFFIPPLMHLRYYRSKTNVLWEGINLNDSIFFSSYGHPKQKVGNNKELRVWVAFRFLSKGQNTKTGQ